MRNPVIVKSTLEKLFEFNYNAELKEKLTALGDKCPFTMDTLFKDWWTKLGKKIETLKELGTDGGNKQVLDRVSEAWDYPEFPEEHLKLFPELSAENKVIAHCDA